MTQPSGASVGPINVTLEATLVDGPPLACGSEFPSGVTTIPFALNTGACPKAAAVTTGAKVRNVNGSATLSGIGPTDDVTNAHTFYARTIVGGFVLTLTFQNGNVAVVPLNGVLLLEPDAANGAALVGVTVTGSGTIEYYAAGLQ